MEIGGYTFGHPTVAPRRLIRSHSGTVSRLRCPTTGLLRVIDSASPRRLARSLWSDCPFGFDHLALATSLPLGRATDYRRDLRRRSGTTRSWCTRGRGPDSDSPAHGSGHVDSVMRLPCLLLFRKNEGGSRNRRCKTH